MSSTGPLNLTRVRLWDFLCFGRGGGGDRKMKVAGQFSTEHYSSQGQAHSVASGCPVRQEEDGSSCVPVPLVGFDNLRTVVLHDRFDVAGHAARLRVHGSGARLAHSQTLQNFLHKVLLGSYGPSHCVALTVLRSGGSL